jgi:hypothetical protein
MTQFSNWSCSKGRQLGLRVPRRTHLGVHPDGGWDKPRLNFRQELLDSRRVVSAFTEPDAFVGHYLGESLLRVEPASAWRRINGPPRRSLDSEELGLSPSLLSLRMRGKRRPHSAGIVVGIRVTIELRFGRGERIADFLPFQAVFREHQNVVMHSRDVRAILASVGLLPNDVRDEVHSSEYLVTHDLAVRMLVVVERDPDRPVVRQQPPQNLQPVAHEREPQGVFDPVVVVREGRAGVVGRVDVDALDLPGELLLQRFEREQVVPEDEAVVEHVLVAHPERGVMGLRRVLDEDARLQPRPVLLADPGQFQSSLAVGHFSFFLSALAVPARLPG